MYTDCEDGCHYILFHVNSMQRPSIRLASLRGSMQSMRKKWLYFAMTDTLIHSIHCLPCSSPVNKALLQYYLLVNENTAAP